MHVVKKKFTTTIDEKLIQQIKIKAIECNTDVNKILEELIEKYLNKDKV